MSHLIPGNQKNLVLNDRIYIENALNRCLSFKDIARFLCKDPTTISKEVRNHRVHESHFHDRLFITQRTSVRDTSTVGKRMSATRLFCAM